MIGFLFSLLLVASITAGDSQITEHEARSILYVAGWPAELRTAAISVMACESSLHPNSVGDSGNSVGLFQIQWTPSNWIGWRSYPQMHHLRTKDISQPIINAQAALVIYRNFGWEPWTCKP
jgi:hypothetical protein